MYRWRRSLNTAALPLLAAVSFVDPSPRSEAQVRLKSVRDKYDVGKVLGSGGFSVVKLAREKKSGQEVAAKFFDMGQASISDIQAEIDMMKWIGTHANIVSLREVIYEPACIVMIMDLVRGGELFDYIVSKGCITEADASRMLRNVCLALQHLHSRGVCHADLKPENVLLTEHSSDADIKIADFGQSRRQEVGTKETNLPRGTLVYWAPEIIKRAPQDHAVDMWAFGVLLYIALTGIHPFDPNGNFSDAQILNLAARGAYDESNPWYASLTHEAQDLIRHLLEVDPDKRYTATEVLAHPWMHPRLLRRLTRYARDEGLSDRLKGYRRLQQLRANIVSVLLSRQLHHPRPTNVLHQKLKSLNGKVYEEVFHTFDKDHNGTISKDELSEMLQAMGQRYTSYVAEIDAIMKSADVDGDGGISMAEFTTLMNSSLFQVGQWDEADLRAAFEIFDINHDGFISPDELAYVINMLEKTPISDTDLTELMRRIDENGDGQIDYKEFSALMTTWLQEN
ncbi:Aste57867_15607 [Aphanomyces stellatus]|uniref:Aste57867_15607 protein n=1 Tax=Aphanomyces stellatus TaxID=120398 RepID=A0A485L6H3_9STRA|nr:hypothetical protein As57867_015551 [Aphanomyces stellatus]VFT92408.1 Aste57867_15607 [Aphanomyces stellatus]